MTQKVTVSTGPNQELVVDRGGIRLTVPRENVSEFNALLKVIGIAANGTEHITEQFYWNETRWEMSARCEAVA